MSIHDINPSPLVPERRIILLNADQAKEYAHLQSTYQAR